MTKRTTFKSYESSVYANFKIVADNFFEAAKLAYKYEYYNAAGVLIIHSAIALADALTIKLSSKKSRGDNHYEVISFVKDIVPYDNKKNKALDHLKQLIDHKNAVSYSGDIYSRKDIDILLKHYERFGSWVINVLD